MTYEVRIMNNKNEVTRVIPTEDLNRSFWAKEDLNWIISKKRASKKEISKKCSECKSTYISTSISAKTCSSKCALARKRRRARERQQNKPKPETLFKLCKICAMRFKPKFSRSLTCPTCKQGENNGKS